ncbi:MAG: ABC transporter substrate-binding protein [Gemmatimonadota bacterium]
MIVLSHRLWRSALVGLLGIVMAVSACGPSADRSEVTMAERACVSDFDPTHDYYPDKADIRHASNFSVSYHGHYKVLRSSMPATNWGPEIVDAVVLHRCGTPAPELEGALSDAPVVETPIQRLATNSVASALRLRELGHVDQIAAMPGNPFDRVLAARVEQGTIRAISGHGAPDPEVLLGLGTDVVIQFASSLEHAEDIEHARSLGMVGLPLLSWAERSYLGQAEWIKHHALLVDEEGIAEDFFARVEARYRELEALVADRAPVSALWATPLESDSWWVEVGNWQDEVLAAARGRNVFTAGPGESSIVLNTERIVEAAPRVAVWISGDPDPMSIMAPTVIRGLRPWQEGNSWHVHGRADEGRDALDWSETPLVRPDLVLENLIAVLHPDLGLEPEVHFFSRHEATASDGGTSRD